MARAKWLAARETELLPVPYFHVVFTLPQQIGALALQNAREIYSILFRAAAETLLTISADPKRLGAAVGFLAVLHTWGQNLHLHPHLHCVVPGGQRRIGDTTGRSGFSGARHQFLDNVAALAVGGSGAAGISRNQPAVAYCEHLVAVWRVHGVAADAHGGVLGSGVFCHRGRPPGSGDVVFRGE